MPAIFPSLYYVEHKLALEMPVILAHLRCNHHHTVFPSFSGIQAPVMLAWLVGGMAPKISLRWWW